MTDNLDYMNAIARHGLFIGKIANAAFMQRNISEAEIDFIRRTAETILAILENVTFDKEENPDGRTEKD